jgi:hypothetical protein
MLRQSNPDNASHAALQAEVIAYARRCGFLVTETTYHSNPGDDPERAAFIRRVAAMKGDVNALVARSTADRIAVHSIENYSFFLEFKTNDGARGNMVLEALPVALHRARCQIGARCLYFYRDTIRDIEGCFWCGGDIPAERIYFPTDRHDQPKYPELEPILLGCFPNLSVERCKVGGSGDPFIWIPESKARAFLNRDWKAVLSAPPSEPDNLTAVAIQPLTCIW